MVVFSLSVFQAKLRSVTGFSLTCNRQKHKLCVCFTLIFGRKQHVQCEMQSKVCVQT